VSSGDTICISDGLRMMSSESRGGHLLECRSSGVTAGVQFLTTLELGLTMSFDCLTCDFLRDTEKDLASTEKFRHRSWRQIVGVLPGHRHVMP